MAIAEGASHEDATDVARRPWMWLNQDGSKLPLSDAPRVRRPEWWPEGE